MIPTPVFFALCAIVGGLLRGFVVWMQRLDEASEQTRFSLEAPDRAMPVTAPSVWDEATKTLTVVVPAYNEQDRLPTALDEMLTYLERKRREAKARVTGGRGRGAGQPWRADVVRTDVAEPASGDADALLALAERLGGGGGGGNARFSVDPFSYELLVVDDGSSDATARVVSKYSRARGFDQVRLLRFRKNRGKGAAVRAGVLASRGRLVLFADADGATRFADLERLAGEALRKLGGAGEAEGSGAVTDTPLFILGSRAHLEAPSRAKRTLGRTLLMRGFHALVALVVGRTVRDTQCGFKLFTRPAARAIFPNQRTQRFGFDVELVRIAQRLSVPMAEVQVTWTEIPGSKMRFTSMVGMALELAATFLGYGVGLWKVREGGQAGT